MKEYNMDSVFPSTYTFKAQFIYKNKKTLAVVFNEDLVTFYIDYSDSYIFTL